jgi:hypothetical protein
MKFFAIFHCYLPGAFYDPLMELSINWVGDDGLYQYDYSDPGNIHQISHIEPVEGKSRRAWGKERKEY